MGGSTTESRSVAVVDKETAKGMESWVPLVGRSSTGRDLEGGSGWKGSEGEVGCCWREGF